MGAVLTKRASASRSTGVGSAVGSPSASALSPALLANPLKPEGRTEREELGTCEPMLHRGLMLHCGPVLCSGPVMHQGPMLHHGPMLCPMWHPGPTLGHRLMLCQGWMQHWGLIPHWGALLLQCHRPVLHWGLMLHWGPTLLHWSMHHHGPVPPQGLMLPCTPVLHQNQDSKQAH